MERKRFWLLTAVVIASGLLGGSVSTLFLNGGSVFAKSTEVVEAREFHLTDKEGNVVAKLFAVNPGHPVLHLTDGAGNSVWTMPPETKMMFVK